MSATRFRPLVKLVLATATVLISAASVAEARVIHARTTGTLAFSPPSTFNVQVNSKQKACRNHAHVSVFRYQFPTQTIGLRVGGATTGKSGAVTVTVPNAEAGEYQLQIGQQKLRVNGDTLKCDFYIGTRVQF